MRLRLAHPVGLVLNGSFLEINVIGGCATDWRFVPQTVSFAKPTVRRRSQCL